MTTAFNPHIGLITVTAHLWGPAGDAYVRLALDTGATSTLIRRHTWSMSVTILGQ
jgi:hypothetical protein